MKTIIANTAVLLFQQIQSEDNCYMPKTFDVIVIGGGPAGIMAAGRAGERGARVLLLEKNNSLGNKILITGKGRCNVTQAKFNLRQLVKDYGQNGAFLFSALNKFGPEKTVSFFENLGVKLKIERGGRVFPESDDAKDIVNALKKYLDYAGVEINYGGEAKNIELTNGAYSISLSGGEKIKAKNLIIATGGLSYPTTGSTGFGLKWAKKNGHTVIETYPALVPLKIKESWISELQGLSLKNVELTAIAKTSADFFSTAPNADKEKKINSCFGEMMFTHFGITGPIVLDISKTVICAMKKNHVMLELNLKPALNPEQLDERLQRDFKKYSNKQYKNALGDLLPSKFIPLMIKMSKINPDKQVNEIKKKERLALRDLLQKIRMTVAGNMGYGIAIVTSGGISIKEIDPKTMQSKKMPNLYFAGEIIDIDGPTGGYNLQSAWATGFTAGDSVRF